MKKLLLFTILFFAAHKNYAQTTRRIFDEEDLKGKVKNLTEVRYQYIIKKADTLRTDSLNKGLYAFDETGNAINYTYYLPIRRDGEKQLVLFNTLTYNIWHDAQGHKHIDTYKNGNKISVSTFDDKGRVISISYYTPKGKPNGKSIFNHDEQGRQTEHTHTSEKGTHTFTRKYTYNGKGELSEIDTYDKAGEHSYKLLFKYISYDLAGNWTKRTQQGIGKKETTESTSERQYVYYQ